MTRTRIGRAGFVATGALAAALLLALGGAARAADDDFEFADGLSRRGYSDLATEIYNGLINDPKATPAKKAEGQYGLALLVYTDARIMAAERSDKKRAKMEVVLAKFDEADQSFAKFITENASHARNLEAKLSRGKLLQDKADYVNVCIEENWVPAGGTAGWQKQVADWYDTAIQLFEAALKKAEDDKDRLKSERKDSGAEWDDATDQVALIWLYKIAALYGKGSALPKGDPAGVAALTQAIKEGSDDYQWEFGESVRGLWAIHYAGLASAALDKPNDAFGYLKTACSFTAEKDPSPAIQDITFQSYVELGKTCLKFGRRDKEDWTKRAVDVFNGLEKAWPEWKKHPGGQRAGLTWADLLDATGQRDRAMALTQDMVKSAEATGSPTKFEATRALAKRIAGGGAAGQSGGALDPTTLMKIARNKFAERDYAGAIRAFQAVLANCDTPEELEKFGWESWDYVGRAYGASQRYYEAYLAYDVIEQAWRRDKNDEKLNELTNETGYSRAAALDFLARQTKDKADAAAAKQALEDFTRDHPTSPRNLDSEARVAAGKLADANSVKGDPAALKAALLEALKAYEALDPKSKSADQNLAQIAQIHLKIGEADSAAPDVASLRKAIELSDAWLAQKRPETTDSVVRRAREQGRRIVLSVALTARADLNAALARSPNRDEATKASQDLLGAVDRLGGDFREVASRGQDQLDQWRAEGLIGAGKADDADSLVGKLLTDNPAGRNNAYLAGIIAAALERRAQEQLAKGDENGARDLMLRSARRSEWVLDNLKQKDGTPLPRNPDTVRAVALRYAKGSDFVKAEQLLLEAQKAYDDRAAAAEKPEDRDNHAKRSRTCRIELIGLLVKQQKYDAAIPQLEKELAKDPKVRDAFLKKMQATDNYTDAAYKDEIAKTDANKALLEQLSAAYMKAPSKERAFAAVNMCYVLTLTMPKDERHGEDWIEFELRRAEAYLMLAEYTRLPEHYRAARGAIQNRIVIPGHMDGYEQTLPGSKKRAEKIVEQAEAGMRKLGAK